MDIFKAVMKQPRKRELERLKKEAQDESKWEEVEPFRAKQRRVPIEKIETMAVQGKDVSKYFGKGQMMPPLKKKGINKSAENSLSRRERKKS